MVAAPPQPQPGETPSATPTKPGTVSARLVLVGRDGEEGEAFPMSADAIDVGREQGAILFGDDAFMSPQHARIERSGDVFTLVDLGSTNGVYLRIRGNSAVYPGDLFMVGHQVLRLENVIEPVAEQPPGPDGTRSFGTPLKPAWGKLALVGRGGVAGDTYFLRGAKVIFGREQGDILFPHDPFVSREHARLRLELHGSQMAVFLEDLGSANGTYIRIRGSAEVRGRDTFRIGDSDSTIAPRPMMRFEVFARTEVGCARERNEDSFTVMDLSSGTSGIWPNARVRHMAPPGTVVAVCDGMGGAAAGDVASKMALEGLEEVVRCSRSAAGRRAGRAGLPRGGADLEPTDLVARQDASGQARHGHDDDGGGAVRGGGRHRPGRLTRGRTSSAVVCCSS